MQNLQNDLTTNACRLMNQSAAPAITIERTIIAIQARRWSTQVVRRSAAKVAPSSPRYTNAAGRLTGMPSQ